MSEMVRRMDARALLTALLLAVCVSVAGAGVSRADEGGSDVVGGQATTIEEWPWQVALAAPPASGGNGYDRQFCGGSLVSPTAIVTAAHCVYDSDAAIPDFKSPGEQTVIAGRTVLSSNAGAEIAVTDVIYFVRSGGSPAPQSVLQPAAGPQLYDENTSEWDVAVLELATPAPASATPIQIASPAERNLWEPGDTAFATGWGDTTGAGVTYPDQLQEVELEVIADSDCGDGTSYGPYFKASVMVCAGIPLTGGKDTCQGDSGGPLVVPAGDGGFRLIGDTSFGDLCAMPEKPGVYGRLADSTMRPALVAAIAQATGNPAPAPNAVEAHPETTFVKRPAKRTRKRTAAFAWSASEPASFACRLDRGPPKPCSSPFVRRVRAGRRHTFEVTAIDAGGAVESTPASYSWKVKKPRRR